MAAARHDAVAADLFICERREHAGRLKRDDASSLFGGSSLSGKLNPSAGAATQRSVRTGRGSKHTHLYGSVYTHDQRAERPRRPTQTNSAGKVAACPRRHVKPS